MKYLLAFFAMTISIAAYSQPKTIAAGTIAPAFSLPDVTGKNISFESFPDAKGYILIFTCNTCPVAQAYEQRVIDLNKKYAAIGYPVIAINPNDPELAEGDSFEAMKERAKNNNYQFPYLFDKGQAITNAYGARSTPHIFLVTKQNNTATVAYTGAIDNDPENSNPKKVNYLEEAVKAVSEGKAPAIASTRALGCSVKRKKA